MNLQDHLGSHNIIPLFYATEHNSIKTLKHLLRTGVNIRTKNRLGQTALHFAPKNGDATIKYLIRKGLDVSLTDNNGRHAGHIASMNGASDALKALIQAGINLNASDRQGYTPLMYAAHSGYKYTLNLLIKAGANVFKTAPSGKNLVHIIAERGHTLLLDTLVYHGLNLNTAYNDKKPLDIAKKAEHERFVTALKGFKNKNQATLLSDSIQQGHLQVVDTQLQNGAYLHRKNEHGLNHLQLAASLGQQSTIEQLLQKDIKINEQDSHGKTALHYATENNHPSAVLTLLKNGANPKIKANGIKATGLSENQSITNMLTEYEKKFLSVQDKAEQLLKSIFK